jgi:hypothetical protein
VRFLISLFVILLAAGAADAQTPSVLRGTIVSISADGAVIEARTRAGEPASVRLKPDVRVVGVEPASLKDLGENSYVGIAAVPDGADGLLALEVHIFPEAMRGAGAGHRDFDLAPHSSMTNGALTSRVESVDGPKLTVSYPGGSQAIRVDKSTKIVAFAPGERSELKAGAEIIARGAKGEDGALEAGTVLVGRGGITPPM